jgi:flagellar hook protein FlgE
MPFDIALSGIRAASNDLSVTGNNIANASTTGFKRSRAEFGDLYATSVLGAGNNPVGSGVRLQDVAQQFTQGSIAFTENEMDMAVNGNGFFVVQSGGEQFYTRSGTFGVDREGYIVTNTSARLQGFSADDRGEIGGLQGDVRIETSNQAPRSTTLVESRLNLDSSAPVLQSTGTTFGTVGNAIGVAQLGLEESTTTTLQADPMTLPIDLDGSTLAFSVNFAGSSNNTGTVNVAVVLSPANFRGATQITGPQGVRDLAGLINSQLFSPAPPETAIDVSASEEGGQLVFTALTPGEASSITIDGSALSVADATLFGLPADGNTLVTPAASLGTPEVGNAYPQQSIDIIDDRGRVLTYTSQAGESAAEVASEMNALAGVSATAHTDVRIVARAPGAANSNNLQVTINGVTLLGQPLTTLADGINALTTSTLPGISAEIDTVTGDLLIHSSVGDDIKISIASTTLTDSLEVLGNPDSSSVTLNANDPLDNAIVVGGSIDFILDEGYSVANPTPPSIGLFGPVSGAALTPITLNAFNANDSATYNFPPTSMKIYDSLGNAHVLNQYFVKQDYDITDPTTSPNHWIMYVKIDGRDVGDPDTTLPPPQNTLPTQAAFDVFFNEDGSLNELLTDRMLISNWTPLDEEGNPNGSLGPQNVLAGGDVNTGEDPINSNFLVTLDGTTQFGSDFSVNDVDQDGYTTGRLSGLNINESGIIFARFTNGESNVLGQIVLADFANNQGLQPVGDSMWAENFESGPPNIGTPGSAALGAIQAGALEESNVDLSEELVNLIVAQRNFQASAKIIETANQVTQTIINLR